MKIQTQPFRQLFEEGRICPARFYCMPPADIDPSLEQIVTSFTGIGHNIVAAYSSHCAGKKAVVYCATVVHAEAVAAAFNVSGIPAAAVLGGQNTAERTANIERFQFADLLVLTNVGVLLTDFHRPEVDAVIMADPTHSSTKYMQQVSAALFPRFAAGMPTLTSDQRRAAIEASSKPFAIVLDLAGNLLRHGIPDVGPAPEPEQPAEAGPAAVPGQMRMVAVPVANLTKQALAYAVAVAEGLGDELAWHFNEDGSFHNIWTDDHGCYRPDEDGALGMELITKHAIGFVGKDADNWLAFSSPADEEHQGVGPTHLVAACRMIVRAQLGDSVQVPEELTRG